jgi:hypothetical protein
MRTIIMQWTSSRAGTRTAIGVLLAATLSTGCQTAPPRNTELMKATGATAISASELRIRLNDYAGRFGRTVEGAADSIARAADGNRPVMAEAIDWKMAVIPTGLRAIFQTDPMAGLIDIWVLSVQQREWIESGNANFEEWQPVALDAARSLEARAETIARAVYSGEDFPGARANVHEFAAENRVGDDYVRASTVPLTAELAAGQQLGTFAAVGNMAEALNDLAGRLNIYFEHLPKQSRWEAERLVDEILEERGIDSLFTSLYTLGNVGESLDTLVYGLPQIISTERTAVLEAVHQERLETMAQVDAMRRAVTADLQAERALVIDKLSEERVTILTEVNRQRVEALLELEELRARTLVELTVSLEDVVDHLFWRMVQLLVVVVVVLIVAALIISRRGRRPGEVRV